jgi:hypothetical protein
MNMGILQKKSNRNDMAGQWGMYTCVDNAAISYFFRVIYIYKIKIL